MDVKLEQRANVKFCVKLGKSGAETFEMIRRAYGNEAMSRARCFEWHARFKRGRTSLEDDERSGRPSTSSAPKNVETIRRLVHEDRRRTITDTAAIVNVSYGTEQTILTCDLNMHLVAAKFVPRLLTPKRKSTVLQFVKSFVSVSWMTHPSCRGSSLGTRVGSTGMNP
jgi:transposase